MAKEKPLWKRAPRKKQTLKQVTKNLTVDILDFFLGIPEAIIYGFDKKEFYRYLHRYHHERELTFESISRWLHDLKRSGYVEIVQRGGQQSVRFTNKAKLAIIDRLAEKVKSENQFYLISFDIPEQMSTQRDKFRRIIKRLGFLQIQKSLWASDKNLGELVELARDEYGVADYVVYAIVESTDIKDTLCQKFQKNMNEND